MNIQYSGLLTKISFILMIGSSLAMPSGSFAGIPVKYITYIACVVSLLAHWYKGAKINNAFLFLFTAVLLFVAFFSLVGSLYAIAHFYLVFTEGMFFVSTMTVTLLILMANSCNAIKDEEIILAAFYGVFIFSLWKFIAIFLLTANIVSFENLMYFFEKYAKFVPVTTEIPGGYHRLTFAVNDFVATFFLFLVPTYPKVFSKVPLAIRVVFVTTATIGLVIAYSRYFFGFIAVLWLYAFLFKFTFKQRFITCSIIIVILSLSLPWFMEVFETRFLSEQADYSDNLRRLQTPALIDAWKDLPILGGGLGFYTKNVIRSDALMSAYEVQWVSFLAKFGMTGISFLVFLVSLLFYKILAGEKIIDHYVLAFSLFCFIISGFTNPYLLNSTAAVFYVLPLILASAFRKELAHAKTEENTANRMTA